MKISDSEVNFDYLEAAGATEKRLKNIFLGGLFLSALVILHLVFLARGDWTASKILMLSFPPILLWSFAVTGYAFYSLWCLNREKGTILAKKTTIDPVTGVKSLEYTRSLLQKLYERGIETEQPTAVLYVDLEKIDVVNNKFGHSVGDIVLRGVANAIEHNAPEGSVVGRVAGDEFVVILPGTKARKAKSAALAITQAVTEFKLDLGKRGQVDFLGCKIGVIGCPKSCGLADEVIRLAQQAAYQSGEESRGATATGLLKDPHSYVKEVRS